MKTGQNLHVSTCGLACLILTFLIGCKTHTYDRGDAAARSLRNAAAEVQIESRHLNFTMTSLQDLVNKPAPDLRPQFQQFSRNLDNLRAAARRNEKAAEDAYKRNGAYLQSWDRQITNMSYEVVRTQSEARRNEVTERFNAVNRRYAEARTTMRPLLSYLNDIRAALSSDLTPGGLESAKPIVANAVENSKKVQLALSNLTNELADSGARMSSIAYETASRAAPMAASGASTNVEGH